MATLGTLGVVLATTLSLAETPTPTTAAPITDTAPAQLRLAADPTAAERDHLARVCRNDVAVKRHGHVVGRLNEGDKFKVIREITNHEFGFEVVAYYGFAYGSVNAKGKVRAGALSCR
ncbi:MAG: hypothetical protein ACRDSK_24160 [Actinophytocola sp.]|uniref:hypothetical protein n=1 Tax=Actinophytocola sp. TaxID=1872138 RepID=UPI003D6C10CD